MSFECNFSLQQHDKHFRNKSTQTHIHTKKDNFSFHITVAVPNMRSGALVVASSTTDTTTDDVDGTSEQQSYFTMTASISGTSNDNGIYVDEIDGSIADPTATQTVAAAAATTEATVTLLWKCKLCTFG